MATGLGILGNNMFSYCNNNPVRYADMTGTSQTERTQTIGKTTFETTERFYTPLGTVTVIASFEVKVLDGFVFIIDYIEVAVTPTGIDVTMPDGETFSYAYDWTGFKPDGYTVSLVEEAGISAVIDEDGFGLSVSRDTGTVKMEIDVKLKPNILVTTLERIAGILPPVGGMHSGGLWSTHNNTLLFR